MGPRSGLLEYEVVNAALAWAVLGTLVAVAVERALSGEALWALLAAAAVLVAAVPSVVARDPREMVAWEVLGLAAVPLVAPYAGLLDGGATYVSVAALALLAVAELDAFTTVEMTPDFAVGFVVVVTMAVAGLWVIAQYVSDVYLGTSFLTSQTAVMWDLVGATAVGVVAGVVFELYVRRVSPGRDLARDPRGEVP